MTNLNTLEELRTKQEIINYFEKQGRNITEEEIENLKQNYAKAEANGNMLTMQQLDLVAGGAILNFEQAMGLLRTHHIPADTNTYVHYALNRLRNGEPRAAFIEAMRSIPQEAIREALDHNPVYQDYLRSRGGSHGTAADFKRFVLNTYPFSCMREYDSSLRENISVASVLFNLLNN